MTQSTIRADIQRMLQDSAGTKFTTTIVEDWIDLAITYISEDLKLDTAQATIALVGSDTFASSEPNYAVPENCVRIREVYVEGLNSDGSRLEEVKIDVIEQDELEARYGPGWRFDEPGTPSIAYRADYNVLGLHNRPDADYNGKQIRIVYDRASSDLVGSSDRPVFMKALHDACVMFCVSRGHDVNGDIKKSAYYMKRCDALVAKFKGTNLGFSQDLQRLRWTP